MSYRERRKELLLALLDQHADKLDAAVDELGRWVDHLRQVGIRGFITENTNDRDFAHVGLQPGEEEPAPAVTADETAPRGTATRRANRAQQPGT